MRYRSLAALRALCNRIEGRSLVNRPDLLRAKLAAVDRQFHAIARADQRKPITRSK